MQYANDIPMVALGFCVLLLSITLRQWAKAWLMDRLGDPTPRMTGVVSLNPLVHFDPLGTLLIPVMFLLFLHTPPVYGWGKHIYSHASAFKHPARGEVLVSLVGSAVNLTVAFFLAVVGGLLLRFFPQFDKLILLIIQQNILLAVFSLLPIPPLEGAFVVKHLFKMSEEAFMRYSQWSLIIFLAFIFIPGLSLVIGVPYGVLSYVASIIMGLCSGSVIIV